MMIKQRERERDKLYVFVTNTEGTIYNYNEYFNVILYVLWRDYKLQTKADHIYWSCPQRTVFSMNSSSIHFISIFFPLFVYYTLGSGGWGGQHSRKFQNKYRTCRKTGGYVSINMLYHLLGNSWCHAINLLEGRLKIM